MSRPLRTDGMRIAVIGAPGHGKSTFLNALLNHQSEEVAEDADFATSQEKSSCTKKVSTKVVRLPGWQIVPGGIGIEKTGEDVSLTLVDTMGFPDPDPRVAATFYDIVVAEAVNHPEGLTAVVWVLQNARECAVMYQQYEAFLKELSQARCKLILVVNGQANYSIYRGAKKQAQREKDKKAVTENADHVIEAIGLNKMPGISMKRDIPVIASTDIEWLFDEMPKYLMAYLNNVPCLTSDVMTYSLMVKAYETADAAKKTGQRQKIENEEKYERELKQIAERLAAAKADKLSNLDLRAKANEQRKQAGEKAAQARDKKRSIDSSWSEAKRIKTSKCESLENDVAFYRDAAATAGAAGVALASFTFGLSAIIGGGAAVALGITAAETQTNLNVLRNSDISTPFETQKNEELIREKAADEEAAKHLALAERAEEDRKKAEKIENEAERNKKVKEAEEQIAKQIREAQMAKSTACAATAMDRMDRLKKYLVGEKTTAASTVA